MQAFLAIVASEPRGDHGDAPVLLRHATEVLLLCAGATDADFEAAVETSFVDVGGFARLLADCSKLFKAGHAGQDGGNWRTKVHSMNILRLLFKDSKVCSVPVLHRGS